MLRSCLERAASGSGTLRGDEVESGHPLARLLPALIRESRAQCITLGGLHDDDVRALLRERYELPTEDESRLVGFLRSRAAGNPFFLLELLQVLEQESIVRPVTTGWTVGDLERAPVPPLVRQIIESRLNRLDAEALRLLEVAAVTGQGVPLDICECVTGTRTGELADALEQARAEQLVSEATDALVMRFSHAQKGVILDITDEKAFEERASENERRFRTLIEQMPTVVFQNPPEEVSGPSYVSSKIRDLLDNSPKDVSEQAAGRSSYAGWGSTDSSEVQFGQRVAAMGMSVAQNGQRLVVGSGGTSSSRVNSL